MHGPWFGEMCKIARKPQDDFIITTRKQLDAAQRKEIQKTV